MLSREELIQLAARNVFSGKVLNNAHRGDIVEAMVLAALGDGWRLVGLGWHPWDLQKGSGDSRVRIQVKQCAALQLWGETKKPSLSFGWKIDAPSYFEHDNPGEKIEPEGWFCDLFVFGVHRGKDLTTVDQADVGQWEFLVIPVTDLKPKTKSMSLHRALQRWSLIRWPELRNSVEAICTTMKAS